MAVRRLAENQPDSFAFTPENEARARACIGRYAEGRQASAVIPLLHLAQEQCGGWLPLALEGYGYCSVGESGKFMREKGIGLSGQLPTNTSGGHLSESYMQGWNHQIECVRQVRGECRRRCRQATGRQYHNQDNAPAGEPAKFQVPADGDHQGSPIV